MHKQIFTFLCGIFPLIAISEGARTAYTVKKKVIYRTFKKGSVDVKKLANVLKVSKNE